jgi:preprotein translocase subunit SecD
VYKRVTKPVLFIIIIVIAAITYLAAFGLHYNYGDTSTAIVKGASDMRFGIDIHGGVDVTFRPPLDFNASKVNMDAAKAVIQSRLDNLKIADRELYVDYNNKRIILRFPWKSDEKSYDPEAAIKELGSMALLTFKSTDYDSGNPIIKGTDVQNAAVKIDSTTQAYEVELNLKDSGKEAFGKATTALFANGGKLSIYMDDVLVETAGVSAAITDGTAVITGGFTAATAKALADKINAGALPFKLETDNFSTISPTLGANALKVMIWAGMLAFILICIFMISYYRLPGFIACIALVGHLAGTLLLISWPQITLTLPGIAGIILSIGMGVDCNIITTERIKEELRTGKTLDGAIDAGFDRSFTAIFDGNITVIIVGIILMWLGSGAVQSFGYTLIVGVVFNFIMGIIASRFMLKAVSKFAFARKIILYDGRAAQ